MVSLLRYEQIDSTLAEGKRLAAEGLSEHVVLVATRQTAGYGRFGRHWHAPPGNLYWTAVLVKQPVWPNDPGLTFAAALAVRDCLISLSVESTRLTLKWPNDCFLDHKKVCGILLEAGLADARGQREYILAGIGINVRSKPDNTYYAATSLSEAGLSVSVDQVEASLTASFFRRVEQWARGGMTGLLPEYRQCLAWVGEEISLTLDKERSQVVRGTLVGIDEVGRLVLQGADGERRFAAGDVTPAVARFVASDICSGKLPASTASGRGGSSPNSM